MVSIVKQSLEEGLRLTGTNWFVNFEDPKLGSNDARNCGWAFLDHSNLSKLNPVWKFQLNACFEHFFLQLTSQAFYRCLAFIAPRKPIDARMQSATWNVST